MAEKKEAECCGRVLSHRKDGFPYAHTCEPQGQWQDKPVTRTCACGEITTMGPFPGRHEADECGGQSDPFTPPTKAKDYNGEDVHPDESPTHTHTYAWYDDDNGHSGSFCACGQEEPEPAEDHRKWCTRCKLLGHYAADCTTAVLEGGVVVDPSKTIYPEHTGQYLSEDPPLTGPLVDKAREVTGIAALVEAGARVREGLPYTEQPDPFTTPSQPAEKVNVSGQPAARYEWYGKQNRGYLVKLPETGDFRRYKNGKPKGLARATTFNKAASDSNALSDWGKRNVLIGASKRPDLVAQAHGLTHEANRDQLMKLVAELETAAGAKVSADVGTLIHELTERWDAGQLKLTDVPPMYVSLIHLYDEALKAAGLRPVPGLIERTTYIPEFGGVVGTLDRVYYHEPSGQYVIGDVKTGKTLKYGMDEIETQEWIYAHGVNLNGVYDWNTDTWDAMWERAAIPPEWQPMTSVSEEWGVVIHMPVQGEDAGKCLLVEADLQRGKRHAQVCHDVREERANKPKPEAWTGEELKAPEMPAESVSGTDWDTEFSEVLSREDAAAVWQKAYDRGVPPEEMARLKELADARLAELAGLPEPVGPMTPELWEQCFSSVESVKEAGAAWEEARNAGVEPLELGRLVGLAQQRLRELGISG